MRYSLFLILALASVSYADDPFACVEADVAEAFLGYWNNDRPEFSTSVPDGFVNLEVPEGLSLIGSRTIGSGVTVAYRADLESDVALKGAIAALGESGWTEADQHRSSMGGFRMNSQPATTTVCHDKQGALSITTRETADQTFVYYARFPGPQGCDGTGADTFHHDPRNMMGKLPTLKLPDGAQASNTGMGGSGSEVSSRVDISTTSSRSELKRHFEDQIRDQNWEFQTSWASNVSSGSVWTLKTAEEGILIGILHVYDSGTAPIRVRFSISPADPANGPDVGSWSSTSS